MYDVITIGSALVDIFVKSGQFQLKKTNDGVFLCEQYGSKIDIDEFVVRTGGGGSNTAVGFARMGFSVASVCEIGKDTWGMLVENDFHDEKVATSLVIKERREQTGGSIILVGSDGGRTVMVHRGASSELDAGDIPQERLEVAEWVHVSSIAGQEGALRAVFKAMKRKRADSRGAAKDWKPTLSWNPGKAELLLLKDGILRVEDCLCRVLIVNKQEWEMLGWVQKELLASIEQIVVTDGERGGKVYVSGRIIRFDSKETNSVDDTGAGDAFCVGYVSAQLYGKKPEEAVRWGVKNAVSVVQKIGAKPGLLKKSQL